jgi:hypothetical protein
MKVFSSWEPQIAGIGLVTIEFCTLVLLEACRVLQSVFRHRSEYGRPDIAGKSAIEPPAEGMLWKGRYRGMLPPRMRNSSGDPAGSLGWRSAARLAAC